MAESGALRSLEERFARKAAWQARRDLATLQVNGQVSLCGESGAAQSSK
jgi:hypothetical protein